MRKTVLAKIATSAAAVFRSAYARMHPPSPVQPAAGSSAPIVAALLADWQSIGFDTPSKPAQYRVYGRKGYVTNGPTYNLMVMLIRQAITDSREERDQDALAKVARVRSLLGQEGNSVQGA